MKQEENILQRFNTIADALAAFGLPKPRHPLVALMNNVDNRIVIPALPHAHVLNFYKISFHTNKLSKRYKYGNQFYDFDEGGLFFIAPGQVIAAEPDDDHGGYVILIHPDFLLGHPLAKKIKQYGFWSYSVNEVLHLSEEERSAIMAIFRIFEEELHNRIDDFSQDVMIAQIELLLTYANRFYKRQFITRKPVNHDVLQRLDHLLDDYFENEKGIPTVQWLAEQVNLSPGYLSDMLRTLVGENAQHLIHHKLIEKAKEKLSTTNLSVAEVAYELGFEYPQSFSKLFKAKTNLSPVEFRKSF